MSSHALATHLEHPTGRGHTPEDAFTGAAGGGACGDLIRISLAIDPRDPRGVIHDAGFDATGCGAAIAAGSATVSLIRGSSLLAGARIGAREISRELGGLSQPKDHGAQLAADALHRALGEVARHRARIAPENGLTLVAMSGGVDSAVAALLASQAGLEPVGVTLELWSDPENDGELSCCSAQAVRSARAVAHSLGMAHFSIDLRAEFRAGVVEPWLSDHAAGETPNPCVRCNGNVRLDAMLELADRLGCATLTTGHYARTNEDAQSAKAPLLRIAADEIKDQSYVLAALAPSSLARLRFPLGHMHKPAVRELAANAGLAVAAKRDSQDLCFLAGTGQRAFLERHGGITRRPGPVIDEHGNRLGEHDGQHAYTIGQRRGLGLAGALPMYVLDTDLASNTVTVGPREQLLASTVSVRDVTLHRPGACVDAVKVRSRGRRLACHPLSATAPGTHERLELELIQPRERTAPGQLACLYAGELIVGHGTIAA
ncbi:MAG TPA: tRNA 2-thiouridine(34) synthase MnmA [Solirubrobacteraceae bacterium]